MTLVVSQNLLRPAFSNIVPMMGLRNAETICVFDVLKHRVTLTFISV